MKLEAKKHHEQHVRVTEMLYVRVENIPAPAGDVTLSGVRTVDGTGQRTRVGVGCWVWVRWFQ